MFTKGEWVIDYNGTIGHIKAIIGNITPTVCRYSPSPNCATYIPEEEQRANAHLIVSAPDMYEALKAIKLWLLEDGLIDENELLNEHFIKANNLANKALAKAEGKEV